MKHIIQKDNIGLIMPRQASEEGGAFITNFLVGHKTYSAYNRNSLFPLYLYPEESAQETIGGGARRTPNLNMEIIGAIGGAIGQRFTPEATGEAGAFAPVDVLDYIYAQLHSPTYRDTYREFLKIDFPRVPYPASAEEFWRLVRWGAELRALHLLESDDRDLITTYPADGDNTVLKGYPKWYNGRVSINAEQYFDGVPEAAWTFYIGGYQPAQKWLKDRAGRQLSYEDIGHYQRMVVALSETHRIMQEIG